MPALTQLAQGLLALPVWAEPGFSLVAGRLSAALADAGQAALAAALEARLPARPEDALEDLAAAARLHVDARRALRAGAWPQAHAHFRAEAQALDRVDERRLALLAQLCGAQAALGGHALPLAEPTLLRLHAQARQEGLQAIAAPAAVGLARALFLAGRASEAETFLTEGLSLARSLGLGAVVGAALLVRGAQRLAAGRLDEAAADITEALQRPDAPGAEQAAAQAALAEVWRQTGERTAAVQAATAAIERLDGLGADGGAVTLAVRGPAAAVLLGAGLRDLGRAQLEALRQHLAGRVEGQEPAWREGLAANPQVRRVLALAAEWQG